MILVFDRSLTLSVTGQYCLSREGNSCHWPQPGKVTLECPHPLLIHHLTFEGSGQQSPFTPAVKHQCVLELRSYGMRVMFFCAKKVKFFLLVSLFVGWLTVTDLHFLPKRTIMDVWCGFFHGPDFLPVKFKFNTRFVGCHCMHCPGVPYKRHQ